MTYLVKAYSKLGGIYSEVISAATEAEALKKAKPLLEAVAYGPIVKFSVQSWD